MGDTVGKLAFMPPRKTAWHEDLKRSHSDQLVFIEKPLKGKKTKKAKKATIISALWYYHPSNDFTVLYSHGNAEDLATSKESFEQLAAVLEVNFLAYDYEGYGLSEGSPSEASAFGDVDAAYNWLVTDRRIAAERIIAFGRSLGSGPTIHLASNTPTLAGLILQSPLRSAIQTQMPHWMAATVLSKMDIFTNDAKIGKVKDFPVFVVHGTEDRVVPFEHGKWLAAEASKTAPSVDTYWVEGCGHNDIEYRRGEEYFRKLRQFVDTRIRDKSDSETVDSEEKTEEVHSSKLLSAASS